MFRLASAWIVALGCLAVGAPGAEPLPATTIIPGADNARLVQVSKDCRVVLRNKSLDRSLVSIVQKDGGTPVGQLFRAMTGTGKVQDAVVLKGGVAYLFRFPSALWQDRPSRRADYYFEFDFRALDGSTAYTCGAKVDGATRTLTRMNPAWLGPGPAGFDWAVSPLTLPGGPFVILKFQ